GFFFLSWIGLRSQSPKFNIVGTLSTVELPFHIKHDTAALLQKPCYQLPAATNQALMCHSEDHSVRRLQRVYRHQLDAILAFDFARVGERIVHLRRQAE